VIAGRADDIWARMVSSTHLGAQRLEIETLRAQMR